jgi:hypothetical protein
MKAASVEENNKIDRLESALRAALKPVSPRVDFVALLRQRLEEEYRPVITRPKNQTFQLILLAAASLFSGIFLVLNGARVILSFLAALGFWREMRKQSNHKRLVPLRPAI